jgi:thiamine pyrophosphate-dependent acetolactate synthase large subunit-like protein
VPREGPAGTPGPAYIEYPSHVIQELLDLPEVLPPNRYRLVNQGADGDKLAEAVELIKAAKNPVLLVGHAVHTSRSGESVAELAKLMKCPVIQTSGGTSFIAGIEDRTFPYGFSEVSIDAVVDSDLVLALGTELGEPSHYGRWRHWVDNEANRKWIYVNQDPTTIGPDATVREAGPEMSHRKHNRLPVVEHGRLVGMVTRVDVLDASTRDDD